MERDIAAHPFTDADICAIQYHASTYAHLRRVIMDAVKRLSAPRIYIADPPFVENRRLEDRWLCSFDLKVTELVNKKASVIEPWLIRSVLRDGPGEYTNILKWPNLFLQEFLSEGLVDVVYLPETSAEHYYYKNLRAEIKQAQQRIEIDSTTGLPLFEYPPHWIRVDSYPLLGLDQISRCRGRSR